MAIPGRPNEVLYEKKEPWDEMISLAWLGMLLPQASLVSRGFEYSRLVLSDGVVVVAGCVSPAAPSQIARKGGGNCVFSAIPNSCSFPPLVIKVGTVTGGQRPGSVVEKGNGQLHVGI